MAARAGDEQVGPDRAARQIREAAIGVDIVADRPDALQPALQRGFAERRPAGAGRSLGERIGADEGLRPAVPGIVIGVAERRCRQLELQQAVVALKKIGEIDAARIRLRPMSPTAGQEYLTIWSIRFSRSA
jgi:hypothetical protein